MPNLVRFQLRKCENLLHFSALYHCKPNIYKQLIEQNKTSGEIILKNYNGHFSLCCDIVHKTIKNPTDDAY